MDRVKARRAMAIGLMALCCALQAHAWGNRGHQLVAYIAYENLDAATRAKADALVQLNPCIGEWKTAVSALPAADQPVALFMLAANWPDRIKLSAPMSKTPYDCPGHPAFVANDGGKGPTGHLSADIPPADEAAASQITGYGDDRRHRYWHFIDTPISGDGTATIPAYTPNVLSELELLTAALKSSTDPSLRSYEMVWIEHLTGDLHQPLHDAQRFSKALPNGDQGGNLVVIAGPTTKSPSELHAYWDDLPGSDSSLSATIKMGAGLNQGAAPSAATLDIDHPEDWVTATVAIAKSDAYAAPFDGGASKVDPATISAAYHAQAMKDMQAQIFLAGHRLAALLENWLN